ncbi:hypothetical protein V5O48_017720 [Marasmius crinis-equi]|uniref:XPG-I domain-containing protein n=1 Tax=Marasmius crinis-equi TaxID=585013 RepID=A0ABR3EN73_9AGAR
MDYDNVVEQSTTKKLLEYRPLTAEQKKFEFDPERAKMLTGRVPWLGTRVIIVKGIHKGKGEGIVRDVNRPSRGFNESGLAISVELQLFSTNTSNRIEVVDYARVREVDSGLELAKFMPLDEKQQKFFTPYEGIDKQEGEKKGKVVVHHKKYDPNLYLPSHDPPLSSATPQHENSPEEIDWDNPFDPWNPHSLSPAIWSSRGYLSPTTAPPTPLHTSTSPIPSTPGSPNPRGDSYLKDLLALPTSSFRSLPAPPPVPSLPHPLLHPKLLGITIRVAITEGRWKRKTAFVTPTSSDGGAFFAFHLKGETHRIDHRCIGKHPDRPKPNSEQGLMVVTGGCEQHIGKFVRRIFYFYNEQKTQESRWFILGVVDRSGHDDRLTKEYLELPPTDVDIVEESKDDRDAGNRLFEDVRYSAKIGNPETRRPGETRTDGLHFVPMTGRMSETLPSSTALTSTPTTSLDMGIKRLWPMLTPAKQTRSLNELAFTEGFQRNHREQRALTFGVDTNNILDSLEAGSHHNLHGPSPLESFFTLLCKYSEAPAVFHLVFDGTDRPKEKRGKQVRTQMPVLYRNAEDLATYFGYHPVVTGREADTHLASLSLGGVIDGVISEDSDLLGLGVDRVLRKSRPYLRDERSAKELTYDMYCLDDIRERTGLGQEGIVLVALLTGNDTQDGLENCGIETAVQLGQSKLARDLVEGYRKYSQHPRMLDAFLRSWRSEVSDELLYNTHSYLKKRRPSAAGLITAKFPNVEVLEHYLNSPVPLLPEDIATWNSILKPNLPDIAGIVSFCREHFHWSDAEMLKRFNRNFFKGAVFRTLHSDLTFYERSWSIKLLKEKPQHTLKNGVECVKATFLLDKILAITKLSNAPSMQLSVWVPLGVLRVAKIQRGVEQEIYDQAASAATTVETDIREDESDDIECLYVARRTASGDYILEFD